MKIKFRCGFLAFLLLGSTVNIIEIDNIKLIINIQISLKKFIIIIKQFDFFDWTDPGFSIGYAANFTSKQVPFGFRAKLAYDHQNFKARDYKEKGPWTSFSKDMIVPEVALKILFGKYRTSEQMYILSLGARYDYAFNAKGPFDSKDAVNNGVSGIIGFEFASPSQHIQMGGNYVIPFYDYFNKNYSPDGGATRPFENAKTSLFCVAEVYMRFGF